MRIIGRAENISFAPCGNFEGRLAVQQLMRAQFEPGIHAAMRAARRSAATTHKEMTRGLWTLASISVTVPLLGCLATLDLILGSFGGGSFEKWAWYFSTMHRLSNALVPAAMGACIGVLTLWSYRHLLGRVDQMRSEMEIAILDLAAAPGARRYMSCR